MYNESSISPEIETLKSDCAFCQRGFITDQILKETPAFRIIADHAPLVPGHLLIVPRNHYTCYGGVPAALDDELFALKQEVQRFFLRYYEPTVFWEHGIFHQTVFHAHLHCFPFGETHYDPSKNLHALTVSAQEDIRTWYSTHGQYFYLEDVHNAFLFAPKQDAYQYIIRNVLWQAALARNKQTAALPAALRQKLSGPFIQDLQVKWQLFQKEEKNDVDPTNT
jgi:diadenosine tetraphosphate (Ap4A) HIT family hydrolase